MIYLIHFDKPLSHAQHYVGYAEDVEQRFGRHKGGRGSALLNAVQSQGINYQVVRTWEGGRQEERQLKRQKNAARYCPICSRKKFQDIDFEKPTPRTRIIGKATINLTPNPNYMQYPDYKAKWEEKTRKRIVDLNKLTKLRNKFSRHR